MFLLWRSLAPFIFSCFPCNGDALIYNIVNSSFMHALFQHHTHSQQDSFLCPNVSFLTSFPSAWTQFSERTLHFCYFWIFFLVSLPVYIYIPHEKCHYVSALSFWLISLSLVHCISSIHIGANSCRLYLFSI